MLKTKDISDDLGWAGRGIFYSFIINSPHPNPLLVRRGGNSAPSPLQGKAGDEVIKFCKKNKNKLR